MRRPLARVRPRSGRRVAAWAAAVVLAAGGCLSVSVAPASGSTPPGSTPPCGGTGEYCPTSASYSGSWKTTQESQAQGVTGEPIIYTAELKWAESFDGEYWSIGSVEGELSETGADSQSCKGTLSLGPNGATVFRQSQENGPGDAPFFLSAEAGGEPDLDANGEPGIIFSAQAPMYINAYSLAESLLASTESNTRLVLQRLRYRWPRHEQLPA